MANSFLDKTGLTYLWGKITALVATKQDTLTFDDSPTNNSSNPVKSGGVYSALAGKAASDHTQAVNKGGTNITSYTTGDILYASGSTTLSKLNGNTTTTKKFLKSVATTSGTATAPAWDTLAAGDIPNLSWNKITSDKPTTVAGYGITDAVKTSGDQTVAGNKTFSGTTVLNPASTYTVSTGTIIPANSAAIIQSPIPKYLWHDIFAFGRARVPTYYTSTNGTTWTEATLEKRLFIHKENWGSTTVLNSSIKAAKWEWLNAGFYASTASWLVIGITWASAVAHFDLLMETSSDGTTWTSMFSVENIYYSSTPIWIKIGGTMQNSLRLTISWNSNSSSSATLPICSIRCLTPRWGDQGKGSELEYPYDWDADANVLPFYNNSQSLGSSSAKWANVYATTLNGSLDASNLTGTIAAAQIPDLSWSKITSGKPTTLSGYGITDAAASGHTQAVNKGGTNITSYTTGDILYASGSTTLAKLAGNTTTTKKFLKSVATTSGTAVAPAWDTLAAADIPNLDWSKITSGKPTTLSGYGITDAAASGHTQAVNKGGTNITSYAVGDILYASGTTTLSKLAGNTTTTQKFLAMTGTGSAGAAPSWVDAPSGEVFTVTLSVYRQVYTANKTFTEIQSAFNSGKTVVVNVPDTGGSDYVLCGLSSLSSSSAYFAGFDTYSYNSSTPAIRRISCTISSSNSVSVSRTHLTSGHAAEPVTIDIYEGDPYTAYCADWVNIDDIYNVAYLASTGDKGYIRALITTNGTSGTPDGAPDSPIDNQWYNLTNAEMYWDYDASEEVWSLYYTFTFSGVFNVNGASYLRTIKVTDTSNSWDNLSGATVTYSESTIGGDYLPLSGGTMTGPITLNNGVAMSTAQEAGWTMNQFGSITHRRANANDYLGIVGSSGDPIRFYYDTGEVTAGSVSVLKSDTAAGARVVGALVGQANSAGNCGQLAFKYAGANAAGNYVSLGLNGTEDAFKVWKSGDVESTGDAYVDGGDIYVKKSDYPYIHLANASNQEVGGLWANVSGKRVYIRVRPSVGSGYATDMVFPAANASANENVYVYTSRNISYNSSTKVLAITSPS